MLADCGSIHGWPMRANFIFTSDPFSLKGREQTQSSLTPTPTLLSLETTKLPEDTPELWKTVGGVQLMPLPQVEQ